MEKKLSTTNKAKENAANSVITKLIKDGQIIGMGSGSTVEHAAHFLGKRVKNEKLDIMCIPTGTQSELLLIENKIPITGLLEHPEIDISIDGADEVDPNLNMIKGGGAALTREKIVASSSKNRVFMVDSSKLVKRLGEKSPIPVELVPFSFKLVERKIIELGGLPKLRIAERKLGPVITDNCNFILDVVFSTIDDPGMLEMKLNNIPGVLENGLFVNIADEVYVGYEDKIEVLRKV